MDGLFAASGKKNCPKNSLAESLEDIEASLIQKLQRPSNEEFQQGIRYTAFPILACLVSRKATPPTSNSVGCLLIVR